MQKFLLNVAATVMAAAIVANVAVLWNVNERLTRIEAQLAVKHVAKYGTNTIASR